MSALDPDISELLAGLAEERAIMSDPETAHVIIDGNRVLGLHAVPGLHVDVDERQDGIAARVMVEEGTVIRKQVHLCFGVTPATGLQRIDMDVDIRPRARVAILAHCIFPNAVDVTHVMDARIAVGEEASYSYLEKHIHSPAGGVTVQPTARIVLAPRARLRTEFELLKGRVGTIDIDYDTECAEASVMEMLARISGRGNDRIKISEGGTLAAHAVGVLTSKIALRDDSRAEIYNKLRALGPYARGHVDCKEIVKDRAVASAVPMVEVADSRAHVTHEAAIGSVDSKQLQTLMARGLDEDQATELIIQGLLG